MSERDEASETAEAIEALERETILLRLKGEIEAEVPYPRPIGEIINIVRRAIQTGTELAKNEINSLRESLQLIKDAHTKRGERIDELKKALRGARWYCSLHGSETDEVHQAVLESIDEALRDKEET